MDQDYLGIRQELNVNGKDVSFYSLKALQEKGHAIKKLPFCVRVLLENVLRNYDGYSITQEHVNTVLAWSP